MHSSFLVPPPKGTRPTKTVTVDDLAAHPIRRSTSLQYTSPVSMVAANSGGAPTAMTLPLNLIALIVSYLDDIGDIARVTRASRLLYYMTLPQLYERVHLHSYAEMRYVHNRPEGFGSGSPFMMALNGLVTNSHASLVQELRIWGEWKELGIEDFTKGRVPDNSMMLNILLRSATDKMAKLHSFCWELNCKPLKTLYAGLGAHNTLTSFTLRFPSTRVPRPSVLVPPMVNLRVFKALDIDPMCYPDDISMLMLHSKKLEDLRLHFSPRMRAEAESTMNLNMFFGRCHKAGYKLKVKHFALQNWFGPNVLGLDQIFDAEVCRSATFIDTFGGNDPRTVFVDDTWKDVPANLEIGFERIRVNEISPQHMTIMKYAKDKVKYLYFVSNARRPRTGHTPSTISSNSPSTPSSGTPYDHNVDPEWISLGKQYLSTISQHHGGSLKHLLLSDLWSVTKDDLADLVRTCPNLEQLGIAVEGCDLDFVPILMPFLHKIRCFRMLENDALKQWLQSTTHEQRMWEIGTSIGLNSHPPPLMEFVCLGDFCYKIGRSLENVNQDGVFELRREVTLVDKSEVMKFDIWRLDTLDIGLDPVYPFSP